RAFQQGPPLPSPNVIVVQASGGHAQPTFYVGDLPAGDIPGQGRMWKWSAGIPTWQQIVPGPTVAGRPVPALARRFYVDPYRPSLLYLVNTDHVLRSDTGGTTWVVDSSLELAVTENGTFPFA